MVGEGRNQRAGRTFNYWRQYVPLDTALFVVILTLFRAISRLARGSVCCHQGAVPVWEALLRRGKGIYCGEELFAGKRGQGNLDAGYLAALHTLITYII